MTKDALLERVWPGLVVEENNLQVQVSTLELVIVAGHIGYPWTDEAIEVATKHENVW